MVDIIELQKAAIEREGVLAVRDANVVARYDATDSKYVVKDEYNRISALLDKSKRLVGVEKITNAADREFTSDTGFWTKSQYFTISNGVMKMTNAPRSEGFYKPFVLTIGKVYKITFDILNTASSSFIYICQVLVLTKYLLGMEVKHL